MAYKSNNMNNRSDLPPAWAEFLLERMLPRSDGQSVSGDLREEYAENILLQRGRLRADCWYLCQILSFVPRSVSQLSGTRIILLLTSLFTAACVAWLAFMEAWLRHPGYSLRIAVDISIAFIPLVTVVVLVTRLGTRTERFLWGAAVALIAFAVQAIIRNLHLMHFEGFVLLISLALVLQGILMLASLGRDTVNTGRKAA